ncbi:MAG: 2-C-methyl-D-erythritol 4-phosphate cytidylyltransferase [Muribaculaceae bacterium]|nr:2-C-methyl-D-erythritol 4-phosphate cytidylyltransferase [Muribaculaceae bacterium]
MEKYVIIVAGGEGTRMGGDLPKQFHDLNGRPMLWWSMSAFHDEDASTKIRLVLNRDRVGQWMSIYNSLPETDRIPHEVSYGGGTRTASVRNGLEGLPSGTNALVAVHDAARPLVSVEMISRGWEAAARHGGAVPAVAVTDSLRRIVEGGSVSVDRNDYVAVQTPQVFQLGRLRAAYDQNPDAVFSDDAAVYEAAGMSPALFEGSHLNMKVTRPGDFEIASLFLRKGVK